MKKLRLTAAVILFPLLLSLFAQGATWQGKKKRRGHVKKMETVSIGTWGGRHVGMEVTGSGATLDFDCAHAFIEQSITLDANGRFDVPGRYFQERGGPVRSDADQSGQSAHFKGSLTGKTLTLTIMIDGSSESIGPFTLEFGKSGRIFKCM
jgi:hypothetical protein